MSVISMRLFPLIESVYTKKKKKWNHVKYVLTLFKQPHQK